MVKITNITDISFNINSNGIKHLKLIFNKNVYNNEIHIKENIYIRVILAPSSTELKSLTRNSLVLSAIVIFTKTSDNSIINDKAFIKVFLLAKRIIGIKKIEELCIKNEIKKYKIPFLLKLLM